ncbi:MAG: cache domain-containing protein [Marinifilaceae bacterium]|jgi:PAS domain S-box-containing protein|nr:cache domain-containing protein [Marinifilaceae bacterium]
MRPIFARFVEDRSISRVFLFSLLTVSFLLIVFLGVFWIQHENSKFERELKDIQETYLNIQKNTLKHETRTLLNFIENERVAKSTALKNDLKARVYEAHAIATNLYKKYKNELPSAKIQQMIINALNSVRFNDGEGCFYINTLSGNVVMDPTNPSQVGKNIITKHDPYGVHYIKREINIVKKQGEGISEYGDSDLKSKKQEKIWGFVKIFKPFNWYIGCTQNMRIFRNKIQEKVKSKITELRFDDKISIAIYDFGNVCLANTNKTLIGKNMTSVIDDNNKKYVQDIVTRGLDKDGGFVRFLDPFNENAGEKKDPKLMYSKAYKHWQWIVASGMQTNEVREAVERKRSELKSYVYNYMIKATFILILAFVFIFTITQYIVKITKSGLNIFTQFYEKAATEALMIDDTRLHFTEFKMLGKLANEMVSNRRKIEHELNIERAYFEQLFENSPEAIVVTDNESKAIKINKQFTSLFGYELADLKGKVIDDLLADDARKEEAEKLNAITARGQLVELETKRINKAGEELDVSIMGNPIVLDKDQIAIFGVYRDITPRKEYEKHLRDAKKRAEESDKLKSAFLANMSHEIRTPMNHILGFTDIMTSQHLEEADRLEYAAMIKQSGANLLSLINNIIDLSKIESKQITLNKEICNINKSLAILYEKFYMFKNANDKPHIGLKVQKALNDEEALLYTDPQRLEQLLSNLIENAVKFTENGYVEFGYNIISSTKIEFFVKDTGIGIAQDALADIFQTFRQGDGSDTRQHGGTGLGLTISHRLAEILGGEMNVKSVVSEGTEFTIALEYEKLSCSTDRNTNEPVVYNWKGKKILIAEDEKNNFAFFQSILEKTNAEVLWAKNGLEAIEICQSLEIDVVLMDIQMPLMNGYEATKAIKGYKQNIPIIGQTAFVHTEHRKKVMEAGCDDFITKPVESYELLESIKKMFAMN